MPVALAALALGVSLLGIALIAPRSGPSDAALTQSPASAAAETGAGTPQPVALADSFRVNRPWIVAFAAPLEPVVTEIFVMTPQCATGDCDVDVQIQDLAGRWLGDGVFVFENGTYHLDEERIDNVSCAVATGTSPTEAMRTSTTDLLLAAYAAPGGGSVTPRIQGTRTTTTIPNDAERCEARTVVYRALGEPTRFAAVATPLPTPKPPPTPKPTPAPKPPPASTPRPTPKPPKVAVVRASFFGSGVTVTTYRVMGATPSEVSRSMSAEGPYSSWLRGRAAGLTKAKVSYRFHLESDWSGACRIVREAKPAIRITFTIVLPRWRPPKAPAMTTVLWWNDDVRGIATHEKVHVDIYRAAQKKLNAALATSTCANVTSRLDRVWAAAARKNCEFDMKEYGAAAGLSLKACLRR